MKADSLKHLKCRVSGRLACFTRPEMKVERVSYPVMTPSAARGVLEAVLWKPAIVWRVQRIHVLKPIKFTAFRRNELNTKAGTPKRDVIENGGTLHHYFADDDRAQRNTLALADVDYIIEARFEMTDKAGPEDNVNKFTDMFTRRVEKGQYFHHPYLGNREFPAEIRPVTGDPDETPQSINQDLGLMLWDIDFQPERNSPLFFQARLANGILEVPAVPLREAAIAGGVK